MIVPLKDSGCTQRVRKSVRNKLRVFSMLAMELSKHLEPPRDVVAEMMERMSQRSKTKRGWKAWNPKRLLHLILLPKLHQYLNQVKNIAMADPHRHLLLVMLKKIWDHWWKNKERESGLTKFHGSRTGAYAGYFWTNRIPGIESMVSCRKQV